MSELTIEQEKVIRDYKSTFATETGKRTLADLEKFCRARAHQGLFDPLNERQTSYNLGAHSVFRYIQSMINTSLENKPIEDCKTEPQI
jgi:hypothetical protein